jgi:hypothetical protein
MLGLPNPNGRPGDIRALYRPGEALPVGYVLEDRGRDAPAEGEGAGYGRYDIYGRRVDLARERPAFSVISPVDLVAPTIASIGTRAVAGVASAGLDALESATAIDISNVGAEAAADDWFGLQPKFTLPEPAALPAAPATGSGQPGLQLLSGSTTGTSVATGRLEPNTIYNERGYMFQTDEAGRLEKASGSLDLESGARNEYAQRSVGGTDRLSTDQGGHLIGARFNGPGDYVNLVPQNANLNMGAWKAMENSWAAALTNGGSVDVSVSAVYETGSARPIGFDVNWTVDGVPYHRAFANAPGGTPQ